MNLDLHTTELSDTATATAAGLTTPDHGFDPEPAWAETVAELGNPFQWAPPQAGEQ